MPNEIPGNAGFLVHTNMAPVTAGVGVHPTTRGLGMLPNTVTQLLPDCAYSARGRGRFSLDDNVPPGDVRFTRGPRLSGKQGTMDLFIRAGQSASGARTVGYLTDDPENPVRGLTVGLDASNRPTLKFVVQEGTSGSAVVATGVLTLAANMVDVAATGTLTSSGQVSDGNTVVIDGKTYEYKAALSDTDGFVQIGGTQALSMENLRRAINLDGVGGVNYAASTTLHPTVSATDTATTVDVTAKVKGFGGNTIAVSENSATLQWTTGANLTGGSNDTVTIDGRVYTFQSVLTNFDGNVIIGGTASISIDNLIAAITLGAGGGVAYALAMTLHPTVTAAAGAGDTMDALAKIAGSVGNSITTTETSANASWANPTLTGGIGGRVTVAEVTATGPPHDDNAPLSIRIAWDTQNPVPGSGGGRYVSMRVNGAMIPAGDWSTDLAAQWASFQPTHVVLGQGFETAADFDGAVVIWQGSDRVHP